MKDMSIYKKWFNYVFRGASLATVAFVFQACYGVNEDHREDQYVTGTVYAEDGKTPIGGIKVTVDSLDAYTTTRSDGDFYLYLPLKKEYQIQFRDVDGENNGLYAGKDTTVVNEEGYGKPIKLDIKLKKVAK